MKNSHLFSGIRGRVRVVFLSISLVTLIAQGIYLYLGTLTGYKEFNKQELVNTADLIYQMTDLYIESSVKNYLNGLADKTLNLAEYYYAGAERGEISGKEAYESFVKLIEEPGFHRIGEKSLIFITGIDGGVIVPSLLKGSDLSQQPDWAKGQSIDFSGFTFYQDENQEKAVALRQFKPWNLVIWVSVYASDFNRFFKNTDLEARITHIRSGEKGYPFVMDSQGILKIHPTLKGQSILEVRDNQGIARLKEIAQGTEPRGVFEYPREYPAREENGTMETLHPAARMGAYHRYTKYGLDWVIVASADYGEIHSSISGVLLWSLIILFAAAVAMFLLVGVVMSILLRPVQKMKEIATKASEGDLRQRIRVLSDDEIGMMSRQFNILVTNFEEVLKRIKFSSSMLLGSVQGLTVSAQEIASTSNEQAAAVKEIVSTMEDSDALAKSVAEKINDVAHIAGKMKETVSDGFSIIKNSLHKMDEIKRSNSETIVGVQALSDKIGSIWEIVNIINSIADQTKIIAFNAELEASAAGEAGKNFQIVATEIRRLADNTVSSTNEIKAKINEIQHSSDNLIISSEEGTAKIKDGWQLSNQLQQVFEDILHSSEISATSADQIALSINQQVAAFEQILLTLKQISEGIDNFVISTKSTTRESEKLKEMADSLNGTVSAYITSDGGEYGE